MLVPDLHPTLVSSASSCRLDAFDERYDLGGTRRQIDFTCGRCERWQKCGLPPDGNCIERAEQIERLDRWMPKFTQRVWTAFF